MRMTELRSFTPARVALGRSGNGLPTAELLDFQLAHARARDAVHDPLDARALGRELALRGWPSVVVKSAARDRAMYLRRPDLGRRLADPEALSGLGRARLAVVLADGLSPRAVATHAVPLLEALIPRLDRTPALVIVEQGRVAIGDEIGERLGAELAVVLIGERPGLTSPDSLGAYVTWSPKPGRSDAERNCVSNIRAEGLAPAAAAELLYVLIEAARTRRLTGVNLKVDAKGLPGA